MPTEDLVHREVRRRLRLLEESGVRGATLHPRNRLSDWRRPLLFAISKKAIVKTAFFGAQALRELLVLSASIYPDTILASTAARLLRIPPPDPRSIPHHILAVSMRVGSSDLEGWGLSAARESGECLRILRDVLRGLVALHCVGIAHFDVKPQNIVREGGRYAIIDFNSVEFLESAAHIASDNTVTPWYRPPEICRASDLPILPSAAVDVWSFGCLAWELVTGIPLARLAMLPGHPKWRPDFPEYLEKIIAGRAAEFQTHTPEIVSVVRSALAVDPAARPTAAELLVRLGGAPEEVVADVRSRGFREKSEPADEVAEPIFAEVIRELGVQDAFRSVAQASARRCHPPPEEKASPSCAFVEAAVSAMVGVIAAVEYELWYCETIQTRVLEPRGCHCDLLAVFEERVASGRCRLYR